MAIVICSTLDFDIAILPQHPQISLHDNYVMSYGLKLSGVICSVCVFAKLSQSLMKFNRPLAQSIRKKNEKDEGTEMVVVS